MIKLGGGRGHPRLLQRFSNSPNREGPDTLPSANCGGLETRNRYFSIPQFQRPHFPQRPAGRSVWAFSYRSAIASTVQPEEPMQYGRSAGPRFPHSNYRSVNNLRSCFQCSLVKFGADSPGWSVDSGNQYFREIPYRHTIGLSLSPRTSFSMR